MDVATAIRTRRTHKAFGPEPLPREQLEELLALANWAPNHNLTVPWRFRVVGPASKQAMKDILADIQSGKFVKDWMLENRVNQTSFKAMRAKCDNHEMEEVGKRLRGMMPWIAERALVDKSKN